MFQTLRVFDLPVVLRDMVFGTNKANVNQKFDMSLYFLHLSAGKVLKLG